MNPAITAMLVNPGRYAITDELSWALGHYAAVEVDDQGRCHQLNRYDERDGILVDEAWDDHVMVFKISTVGDRELFVRVAP